MRVARFMMEAMLWIVVDQVMYMMEYIRHRLMKITILK